MTDDVEDIARADTATIIQQTPGTVCGYPSITVAYTIHGMESMALIVTSSSKDRKAWRVRLNFLSHDPHNRRWIEDTQAITTGGRNHRGTLTETTETTCSKQTTARPDQTGHPQS